MGPSENIPCFTIIHPNTKIPCTDSPKANSEVKPNEPDFYLKIDVDKLEELILIKKKNF